MSLQERRISAFIPSVGKRLNGILCGIYKSTLTKTKVAPQQQLMVVDQGFPILKSCLEIGIIHSTLYVDMAYGSNNEIRILEASRPETWEHVPQNVGVYASRDFEYDGVYFPKWTAGRVSVFTSPNMVRVLWEHSILGDRWIGLDHEKFSNLAYWEVPSEYLEFGTIDLRLGKVTHAWGPNKVPPASFKKKFQVGDMVTYVSPRSHRIVGNDGHSHTMGYGTILKVIVANRGATGVTLIGNCQSEIIGANAQLDSNLLAPFLFPWFPEGEKVRVTKEVMFQKRSLQDQIGIVLSSTDQDGDVGIQFQEDIGAGSLDGLGPDGRCLFVPSKALEISG